MACKPLNETITISKINENSKEDLNENGRLQSFFHCPTSTLPIRDVLGENKNNKNKSKKTEPHIEIGAENYCNACLPKNINGFIENKEKYLFLMTKCCNKKMKENEKRFIVGYIQREVHGKRDGHYFIKGKTYVYSFEDAIDTVADLKYSKFVTRSKKPNEAECEKILKLFEGKNNILPDWRPSN